MIQTIAFRLAQSSLGRTPKSRHERDSSQTRPFFFAFLVRRRGNNCAAVFHEANDYLLFLKALAQMQKRNPFRLFGFCLMTNHFQLLLAREPGQVISRILQSLIVQ